MKKVLILALVMPIFALPAPQAEDITIDPSLVPTFGLIPGIPSVTQLGSC